MTLVVRPRGRLTDVERAWLKRHKADVLSLLQPATQAPLPPGWRDVHVYASTVDEMMATLEHEARPRRRRGRVY